VPLYEYECPKDGVFELVRKFSDPPLSACPKCSGPIEKLASAPAIQFKGTGWYVTDYARKGKSDGDSAKSDKAAAKSESESKSDKSESKSESKNSKDSSSSRSADSASSSTSTSGTGSSSGSSTDKK
jgi:putative FmdB family regulatory protein